MKRRGAVRAATGAAALVLVSLGVIGLVVEPSQLLWSILLGASVACAAHLRNLDRMARRSTTPVLCDSVVLAGVVTVAVCAVFTGLVAVLGAPSVPLIVVLVLASALWVWRRSRRACRPATAIRDEQVRRTLEMNREVSGPHVAAGLPAVDLSVAELCLAWRRSYLVLIETPYGALHDEVVSRRRELLDELEQRDHAGFGRWIDTGARAASDPGPYLCTDR